MRILLLHGFYRSGIPSGENQVFAAESRLLKSRGHEVVELTKSSDELGKSGLVGKIRGGLSAPWNPFAADEVRRAVDRFQPDVIHAHNTFPRWSPSVFYGASRVARVLTLHNYRLFCSAAIPMRDGQVCTECLDTKSVRPALIHGCYRGTRLATLPVATSIALHRTLGTWTRQVEAYIALTEFQRRLMIDSGLPEDRVHVKPNFYPGNPSIVPWERRGNYIVFAGRLSQEKGIESLLAAWRAWGAVAPELRIVGDGPLASLVRESAVAIPSIRALGQLSSADAEQVIAHARLMIVPSEWFEGFPMVIREAFAFGTPVAASNIGALPSIVRHGSSGLIFEPRDPVGLLEVVQRAWQAPRSLEALGKGARAAFDAHYTEDSNYTLLMRIYEQALALRSS